MDLFVPPVSAGAVMAALAVAGGAPLFGDGLRTLRLRRGLQGIAERPLAELPAGVVRVRGRVALEGPLFAPLSGKPCAAFRLEVRGALPGHVAVIEERRAFRLVSGTEVVRVLGGEAEMTVSATGVRELAPRDPVTDRLDALLRRCPEARWLRHCGVSLAITEHALLAGQEVHVIGYARQGRAYELQDELEEQRTGTDLTVVPGAARRILGGPGNALDPLGSSKSVDVVPELWIDAGGHLGFLHVTDHEPNLAALAPSSLRQIGLALGPLLSLTGLVYLARVAERWQAGAAS